MENLVSLRCTESSSNDKQPIETNEIEYTIDIDESIAESSYSIPALENNFVYQQLDKIEKRIDFLTSDADQIDCLVAASSGILCATIDAIMKEMRLNKVFGDNSDGKDLLDFLNESGGQGAQKKIEKTLDNEKRAGKKMSKKAQKSIDTGNTAVKNSSLDEKKDLSKMVEFLEKRFNIPSDSFEQYFGGGTKHHLNDFAHHPSIIGLFFSILTQYTYKMYGTDNTGAFKVVPMTFEDGQKGRIAKIKDGNKVYLKVVGETPKEKWFFGVTVWYYHLISDIAGSSGTIYGYDKRGISTVGKGAGIPGPLMSLAKALSALPIFNKTNDKGENENKFAELIDKLYSGNAFKKVDENGKTINRKIDYRTEKGLQKELASQGIMVMVNDVIVSAFYYIRRLAMVIKDNNIKKISELKNIELNGLFNPTNRTLVRMMTISTGSFTATNLAIGAAISAVKSGGEPANFAKNFVMRINFVGVGRFFVAIGADFTEGALRAQLVNNSGVFKANQELITSNLESQSVRISQGFADFLDGTTDERIARHIGYLGEENENQ